MRIFALPRTQALFTFIGVAIIAAIWIGSLMPIERLPRVGGGDKLHHFAAYAACGFWWCLRASTWRARACWMLGLAAMGAVIELLQGSSGYRHFETADMIANAAGAVAGGVLASIVPFRPVPVARSS